MADVIRLNHGMVHRIGRKERSSSFLGRIMHYVSVFRKEWDNAVIKDVARQESKYKIEAYCMNNVICGSD